jgi:AbrB family looped-hinge helix DNA binding protein
MTTTIDGAGRIVIPKAIRDQLGLTSGSQIEIEIRNGLIEIEPAAAISLERHGRFLVAAAPTGTPLAPPEAVDDFLSDFREGRAK